MQLRESSVSSSNGSLEGARGHSSVLSPVHRAHSLRIVPSPDEFLGYLPGVDTSLFRIRHHPVPADGCGHHFQARSRLYRRERRRGRRVHRLRCVDRRAVSYGLAFRHDGRVIAIVVAAFLFQPFRDWIQARLDKFFYRDVSTIADTHRVRPHAHFRVRLDPCSLR